MGVLESGLALAGALPPAAPPAPGTGVPVAPPSAAPAPVASAAPATPDLSGPPVLSVPTAVQQALAIGSATQKAAAAAPLSQAAISAAAQDKAARDDAAAKLQANQVAYDKIANEPTAPRAVPAFAPLPKREDYVKATQAGLKGFAQFLPVLAALGSLATREPALNALKAGTAMMDAIHAGNVAEEAKQRQEWLDQTNEAVKSQELQNQAFRNVLDDAQLTATDKAARLNTLAVEKGNIIAQAALKGGNLAPLVSLMQTTEAASQHLAGIVTTLSGQDIQNRELGRQWFLAHVDAYKAQIEAGKLNPNDIAGQLFAKAYAAGGYDKLPPEDQDLLSHIAAQEAASHPAPTTIFSLDKAGGAPGASTPAAAPAPPAAAAAPTPAQAPAAPAATAVPRRKDGVYLPQTAADMAHIPPGAQFLNPADGRVLPKRM